MQNQLLLLSKDRDRVLCWRSGVSLHSHTRHSREGLGFIAKLMERRGRTHRWFENQKATCLRRTGIALDLEHAYWTPPLCERQAHEVERRQIAELGLRPMVSLTDHDRIDANVLLREDPAFEDTPISTEWTIPFGDAVFHFGVHNLPAATAQEWMQAMREATASADETRILGLFAELNGVREALVIFNHPLWNFFDIPAERFTYELTRFLKAGNEYVHAFELNGMRNHEENRGVIRLAEEWNQLLISGGDRHGCEPNTWLNLTNAADFAEFAEEIRTGRQSTVLVMPQYAVPLGWRLYQTFTHVIAEYPEHPEGRQKWDERTFHPGRDGLVAPMKGLWLGGPPGFLKKIFAAAMMGSRAPFGLLGRWNAGANESLRLPGQRWAGASGRGGFGDGIADAGLEDYLYGSGEPAAD